MRMNGTVWFRSNLAEGFGCDQRTVIVGDFYGEVDSTDESLDHKIDHFLKPLDW